MKKLPNVRIVTAGAEEKATLCRWLTEWHIERGLCDEDSDALAGRTTPRPPAHQALSAKPIAPGQIRLLRPFCAATASCLRYFVVLERSSSDAWLIAPFGRFSEPAVPGEWRTGRRSAALRVLCLWNAHDLPEAICSQSWVVDRLSEQKRTTALAVRQFQLEGRSLRAVELRHVGPPLLHPLDPRHEYLEQEEGWMTVLRRFVPADVVMYSPSKDSDRTSLPLAAEERVKYRTRRDAKENPRRDDSNS